MSYDYYTAMLDGGDADPGSCILVISGFGIEKAPDPSQVITKGMPDTV